MRRRDAPRRNLSRRDPMYFRHFTRVLSSMDADSSIARSDRCLFTGLQREVINYRLTRVNGRGEKERERGLLTLLMIDDAIMDE